MTHLEGMGPLGNRLGKSLHSKDTRSSGEEQSAMPGTVSDSSELPVSHLQGFDTRLPAGHLYACSLSVGAAHFPPHPRFKKKS